MPFTYPYPRPALTVDVAVFCAHEGELEVLLIERGKDPFAGHWALPGGFVDQDEDLPAAALRELAEETGLEARLGPQVGAYGTPGRDPRGHTVSVVYLAWLEGGPAPVEGLDDAVRAAWHRLRRFPKLAFDHRHVLRDALDELRRLAGSAEGWLPLLPREFEVDSARQLLRAAGTQRSSAAVRRQLRAAPGLREITPRGGRLRFRQRT